MKALMRLSTSLSLWILLSAPPVSAITYGQPDGDRHPNVGAALAEYREPGVKSIFCSGTLIAPEVFLTASHCTAFLESRGISPHDVWVSFDSVVNTTSTLIRGTYHTNPAFGHDIARFNDVAVIVLDSPSSAVYPGIQAARLPEPLQLSQMAAANGLRGQRFTPVGYGALERQNGGGPPYFPSSEGIRRHASSSFRALTGNWLHLSQNPATGDSGTCYGDSGGPNFIGTSDVIAGVTVTGDVPCRATNVIQRLDIPSVRSFIRQFVPNLP